MKLFEYRESLRGGNKGDIATEIARRTGGVQRVVKLFEYRESLRGGNKDSGAD